MVISNPTAAIPLQTDADGVVRVSGTRVTLDTIIAFYRQGQSAEQIAAGFPSVPLADIHTIIGYFLAHRPEVEAYLVERERQHGQIKRENQARWSAGELRERLLPRQTERGS